MRDYIGCAKAHEISKVREPMNKLSQHLVSKNDKTNHQPSPENIDMATEAEIQKAAQAIAEKFVFMSDIEKAHYKGLTDEAKTAFLAKSDADRLKEAEAAKAETDRVAAEAEAAKTGKSVREAELEKKVNDQDAKIAALEKRDADRTADAEVEKAAAAPEYAGFPGGQTVLVERLKSLRSLPETERKEFEDVLKARAADARRAATTFGVMTEEDLLKSAPVQAEVAKKVTALREKNPDLDASAAQAAVFKADPDLMSRALAEERSHAAKH